MMRFVIVVRGCGSRGGPVCGRPSPSSVSAGFRDVVIERKRGGKFYFPFATIVLLSMLFNASYR